MTGATDITGGVPGGVPDGVPGGDGRPRCNWALSTPEYVRYHDEEWGVPLHGRAQLFERMCLESFQSGLSWLTILRKRPAFRAAFAGFEPDEVADFDDSDVERLLADASIVRNRAKIDATIRNARLVSDLDLDLDGLLWSFAPDPAARRRPPTMADVPAITDESRAMARELKRRGFVFLGPTTCYALMQATGMVDDHIATCWRARLA